MYHVGSTLLRIGGYQDRKVGEFLTCGIVEILYCTVVFENSNNLVDQALAPAEADVRIILLGGS